MNPEEVKHFMRFNRWNRSNAVAYDAYRRLSRREGWKRLLARSLKGIPAGAAILEVGSGTGFITAILAELGFSVQGIDLSEEMLAVATANLQKDGWAAKVNLSLGDAESLNFDDHCFDAVVSRWVLWTLPRPQVAICEMARVLKPGGSVVLIDGSRLTPGAFGRIRANLLNWILTGRPPGWRGPDYAKVQDALPHFTPDQTAASMQANGLDVRVVEQDLESKTDGKLYFWLMGGTWSSYFVKGVKPA